MDPRVLAWTGACFEQALAAAAAGTPSEAVLLPPHDVEKLASRFHAELGDAMQTLPGGKEEVDALLLPADASDAS